MVVSVLLLCFWGRGRRRGLRHVLLAVVLGVVVGVRLLLVHRHVEHVVIVSAGVNTLPVAVRLIRGSVGVLLQGLRVVGVVVARVVLSGRRCGRRRRGRSLVVKCVVVALHDAARDLEVVRDVVIVRRQLRRLQQLCLRLSIALVAAKVHAEGGEGWHVVRVQHQRVPERSLGLHAVALRCLGQAIVGHVLWRQGVQMHGPGVAVHSFAVLTQSMQCCPHVKVSVHPLRLQVQELLKVVRGAVVLAKLVERQSLVVERVGVVGISCESVLERIAGLLVVPLRGEGRAEVVVRGRVLGPHVGCLLEVDQPVVEPLPAPLHHSLAQAVVHLGVGRCHSKS
mmetsp:Transcript_8878/g.20347  ORF Transcript_8878/g.20347 Transcript_8878/m.20347 type:complete len:338 (+) Transcript_8878:450-1463(+)